MSAGYNPSGIHKVDNTDIYHDRDGNPILRTDINVDAAGNVSLDGKRIYPIYFTPGGYLRGAIIIALLLNAIVAVIIGVTSHYSSSTSAIAAHLTVTAVAVGVTALYWWKHDNRNDTDSPFKDQGSYDIYGFHDPDNEKWE